MPEISRFYGIVIRMYFGDHSPPHFHAAYGDNEAVIDIGTLAIIAGKLPPRATGMVMEWASLRRNELMDAWQHAQQLEPFARIDPLP